VGSDPVEDAVRRALAEDLGAEGPGAGDPGTEGSGAASQGAEGLRARGPRVEADITTRAVVPPGARGRARLLAREEAVLAGSEAVERTFALLDPEVVVTWAAKDGDRVAPGDVVATVEGPLRAILAGERTALNFLGRLSGVATLTRRFVEAAGGVEVRPTRKTTPGLRALERAAVRAGGGGAHRMGLFDAYLVKDNHVAAAGGIRAAVERVRAADPGRRVEVECETLAQVREALEAGADEVLLDNMDLATLREAVRLARGRARTEASGRITLATVGAVAATGVDAVSVGALTHSAPAVDFSLEVEPGAPRD
jgi:nicotinate-nucleotide pyrophosphorylase (carboxylating)